MDSKREREREEKGGGGFTIPIRQTVFHMIQRRINENFVFIPGAAFDSNGFVNDALLLQLAISNDND